MAILVDPASFPWRGRRWAHLVSDTSHEELHAFAAQLGLRREWFQGDHYDVPTGTRERAIEIGAEPVSSHELVRRLRAAGLRRRGAAAHRLPVDLDEPRMPGLLAGADSAMLVLPVAGPGVEPDQLDLLHALLELEVAELDNELGVPTRVGRPGDAAGGDGATLELRVVADGPEGPLLRREGPTRVVLVGRTLEQAADALHLLRTARRTGATTLDDAPAADLGAALDRLEAEVATSYPAFGLRELDWAAISDTQRPLVDPEDPVPGLQRWVARLADAHTSVRQAAPWAPVPMTARLEDDRVTVVEVAPDTALAAAGVGPGWTVEVEDLADLASRWGASPQSRPWTIGRRAVSGPAGAALRLHCRAPDGRRLAVDEVAAHGRWPDHLAVTLLTGGTAVLRLRHWSTADADALDDVLASLGDRERLLVDLRGNPGGQLVAAARFRDRLVEEETVLGTVRHSRGGGGLTEPSDVVATPSDRVRRAGRTRFLVDGLTYSASEDAIMGLSQLPHVDVVGTPSGGGSGRARTVHLLPGVDLTVSTALTHDHTGRCIEGAGIQPDTLVDLPVGPLGWEAADRDW